MKYSQKLTLACTGSQIDKLTILQQKQGMICSNTFWPLHSTTLVYKVVHHVNVYLSINLCSVNHASLMLLALCLTQNIHTAHVTQIRVLSEGITKT